MVQVVKFGQMVRDTKGNGAIIKQMEKENSGMQMVIFMKELGRKIKQMVTVCMFIKMAPDMKVNGKTIYKMELAVKLGVMEANIKVVTKKVKSMVKDIIFGMTTQCTMDSGMKTK